MIKKRNHVNAHLMGAVLLAFPLWTSCVPVEDGVHEEEELSAQVHITPSAVKTLEEATFEVEILDSMGGHMMDMAAVSLEVRTPDGEWREIELAPMGEHYMGTRTFSSSGDYEIRVSGMPHAGHDMDVMHTMMIHVERAHLDAGPFHVEYENFPGHVHAGDEAMLMFWVTWENDGTPAAGLSALIVVEESDGHVTEIEAEEIEPGVYQAPMLFADSGNTHVGIMLVDEAGAEFEADFHSFSVSASH